MIEITVFTPTYNRAYIIKNVYDSLLKQNYNNFEWLVIDDGSSDNTEELISSFMKENKIDIVYIKKENGGQHTALNLAIEKARGRLIMIVDSDDYLTDNALKRVAYWESTIHGKDDFAGVAGLKVNEAGEVIGDKWTIDNRFVDATNFQRKKCNLRGDKAEAYYTSVLKKYGPIPIFEGENDVEKAVLWNRIANDELKIRWFDEGIYICEYLKDGMSMNIEKNHLKNFQGFTCWKKELIDMQKSYIRVVAETSAYIGIAQKKGLSNREMAKALSRSVITIICAKIYAQLHILKGKMCEHNENK